MKRVLVPLAADSTLDAVSGQQFDLIALPGGMPGAANLLGDSRVGSMIRRQHEQGGHVAAICAAPMVVDDRVITSRGPGTAIDFALELVAQLAGPGERQKIEAQLQRSGARQ
ncbi:MAG: DJ-1/PfpI family protein [Steroidobacteraceae bacterium]